MQKNKRADRARIGEKTRETTGENNSSFSVHHSSQNRKVNQCKNCGSDYMRFAIGDFCQRCLQRAEFIVRERPRAAGGRS